MRFPFAKSLRFPGQCQSARGKSGPKSQPNGSGYPDCTADFISKIESAVNAGTSKDFSLQIVTPLVNLSKADIVRKSLEAGSPLELTWSCYEREDEACGECDSCRLRLRGFELAGEKDRIKYVNLK